MTGFEAFVVENAAADLSRLLLSCKAWPAHDDPALAGLPARDLAVNTIEGRRRLMKKVPAWYHETALVYPTKLCTEQCSSSGTARYKASVVERIFKETPGSGRRLADLTGGLGIDSWAFSKVAAKVLYNEMSPALALAARHNFAVLGADNIVVRNFACTQDSLRGIIGSFAPEVLFLDPARRSSDGKKVFLLEDCSPDVPGLVPELLAISRHLLLKLSPMADISRVIERLNLSYEAALEKSEGRGWNGQWIREVHVVAAGGECKELLVWMDREWHGEYSLTCVEDGNTLSFTSGEIASAKAVFPDSPYLRILFEPGKSLTKAGAYNAVCQRFSLVKLARFTHLYTLQRTAADCDLGQLRRFGKVFKVVEVLPLNKAGMRDVGKRFPHSEVTARNLPVTSDELRSRLGVSSGEDVHIFGARFEMPYDSGNYLIVCEQDRCC